MTKRRKWIFAVLAGLLVIVAIRSTWSEPEPSYQGRPLSYWLTVKYNDDDQAIRDQPNYEEAIREMGTNCLPFLLRWIAYEPPAWKTKLINSLSGVRWIPESLQDDRTQHLANESPEAFLALGRRASPAIPQLTQLAKDSSRGWSAYQAASVLISFGPETQGFVLDLLDDPRPMIRTSAIYAVAQLGTNALPAIPSLINFLKDPDEQIAGIAAHALGELRLRPELSVPALSNALQDGRFQVAFAARAALIEFGHSVPAVGGPQKLVQRDGVKRYGPTKLIPESIPQAPTNASPVRAD